MINNLSILTTLQAPRAASSTRSSSFADSMKTRERDFRNDLDEARSSRADETQKYRDIKNSYKEMSKNDSIRKFNTSSEKAQHRVEDEKLKPEQEEETKTDKADEKELTSLEELLNMLNTLMASQEDSEADEDSTVEGEDQINPLLNDGKTGIPKDEAKKTDVNLYRGVINELFTALEKSKGQTDNGALQQGKLQNTDIEKLLMDPETKAMLETLLQQKLQEMKQTKESEAAQAMPVQTDNEQTKAEQILKAIKAMQKSTENKKLEDLSADKSEKKDELKEKLESMVTKMTEGQQEKTKATEKPLQGSTFADSIKLNLNKVNENLVAKNEQLINDKVNTEESMKLNTKNEKLSQVPKFEVLSQIVKKAQVGINGGRSEMNMQLEPENLGKLNLKVVMEKGIMTAKFVAENPQVKEVIETNFNQLRDMLQEKGIAVQSFSVSVGHDGRSYEDRDNYRTWKEFNKNNSNTNNGIAVEGYGEIAGYENEAINPYVYHDGKIDYKA